MGDDDGDYSSFDDGANSKRGLNNGDGVAALAADVNGNPIDDKSSAKLNAGQANKVEKKRLSSQEKMPIKARHAANESSTERQSI